MNNRESVRAATCTCAAANLVGFLLVFVARVVSAAGGAVGLDFQSANPTRRASAANILTTRLGFFRSRSGNSRRLASYKPKVHRRCLENRCGISEWMGSDWPASEPVFGTSGRRPWNWSTNMRG